jgi:nitrate reductase NapE component
MVGMVKIKTVGKISEFVSGEYKVNEKARKFARKKNVQKVAMSAIIPIASCGTVGALGFVSTVGKAFASESVPVAAAPIVVEATAKEWMGEQTLSALAHVLDPVVDVLVALSFPIASVVIVGACFFFMFGNSEKAWTMIQNAGLGYVLIQVSPLILNVLKQVGNAV